MIDSLAEKTLDEYKRSRSFLTARDDPNIFIESLLRNDETGEPIEQGGLHRAIQKHLLDCMADGKWSAVIAPRDCGKTTQILGFLAFIIGRDPNIRAKIWSNVDNNAIKRGQLIRDLIEKNPNYRFVFPEITPDRGTWSGKKFKVVRRSNALDPTVEALGITESSTGGRADIGILDDVCDFNNAIVEPAKQKKIIEKIDSDIIPMFRKLSSFLIYLATPWTDYDATAHIQTLDLFSVFWAEMLPDFSGYRYRIDGGEWTEIPIESEERKQSIIKKTRGMTPTAVARAYFMRVARATDYLFATFDQSVSGGIDNDPPMPLADALAQYPDLVAFGGVDISSMKRAGTALFVIGVTRSGQTVPLSISVGKWGGPKIVDRIAEITKRLRVRVWFAEDNATQDQIIEFFKQKKLKDPILRLDIRPFTTSGSNKRHEEKGLPGLASEFELGKWSVHLPHKYDKTPSHVETCAWCRWVWEMRGYPFADTTDLVMACWFAREAARENYSSIDISKAVVIGGQRESSLGGGAASSLGKSIRAEIMSQKF